MRYIIVTLFILIQSQGWAFVVLNTSSKEDSTSRKEELNKVKDTIQIVDLPPKIISDPVYNKPHYPNVLFLSSENMTIYAFIGILKALEEYGLDFNLILAESKATYIATAWALGYSAIEIEKKIQSQSLEYLLRPMPKEHNSVAQYYIPQIPAKAQFEIPLQLETLFAEELSLNSPAFNTPSEFLHLSWNIAKLTYDAPNGPIEDLAAMPKPLAIQVTNLNTGLGEIVLEGYLQNILKGSLLPKNKVRERPKLSPYASGELVSGHQILFNKLPFTFDHLFQIENHSKNIPIFLI